MSKYVFVSGPYTHGDVEANVFAAVEAGEKLWTAGYVPFVPHLTHYWHALYLHAYEEWLAYCLSWLARCDSLVRLPGFSPGADREEAFAKTHGIPILTLEELLNAPRQT